MRLRFLASRELIWIDIRLSHATNLVTTPNVNQGIHYQAENYWQFVLQRLSSDRFCVFSVSLCVEIRFVPWYYD